MGVEALMVVSWPKMRSNLASMAAGSGTVSDMEVDAPEMVFDTKLIRRGRLWYRRVE
jgi:hypothetical protein